jgi:hypothetical protein
MASGLLLGRAQDPPPKGDLSLQRRVFLTYDRNYYNKMYYTRNQLDEIWGPIPSPKVSDPHEMDQEQASEMVPNSALAATASDDGIEAIVLRVLAVLSKLSIK